MTQPTKADLEAAVTRLTEEKIALLDIFAAAYEAAGKGKHPRYILGYLSIVAEDPGVSLSVLRTHAAHLREVAAPAPSGAQDPAEMAVTR